MNQKNCQKCQKFYFKYKQEQKDASDQLAKVTSEISNPEVTAEKAVTISTELNTAWASGDVKRKEQLQKLLFPEGIVYDLKTNAFRTDQVNVVFMHMAQLANNTGAKEKGQTNALACLSLSADWTVLKLSNVFWCVFTALYAQQAF